MTLPKRPRRRTAALAVEQDLPPDLLAWFRGEAREKDGPPWSALIYSDYVLLRERWQAFKDANPDARPPAGYEDECEGPPPQMLHGKPYEEALAMARRSSMKWWRK